jgi:uncharacterized protein (TIGR00369 family)
MVRGHRIRVPNVQALFSIFYSLFTIHYLLFTFNRSTEFFPMRHKVHSKQPNSRMCLVCGLKNPFGLKASYYELENGDLVCVFRPEEHHQSYPGRTHGGIAAAVLDETIGRSIMHRQNEPVWGVTVELSIRYRKPIPYGEELRAVGRITNDTSRIFEGTGELLLADGTVAVEASGKYLKMPIDRIADFDVDAQEWKVTNRPGDPEEIEI